ncbi:hypothetical protein MBLNU230_g3735t1 [Neophaeotheca triangularis]
MSSHLWKAYYEDDVDTFRQLLETSAGFHGRPQQARGGSATYGSSLGNTSVFGTSPTLTAKARKNGGFGGIGATITRGDVNWRDAHGLTLLHHAASSVTENGFGFAAALIDHPHIDLYVQDQENGWTALHRAFYFGNIAVARQIMERDAGDAVGTTTGHVKQTSGLVKVKDREGYGPLDLYAATIKDRTLRPERQGRSSADTGDSDDEGEDGILDMARGLYNLPAVDIHGDEVFTFGSNKNVSLGFGDEDDRQFPERITLRRPEHLLRRFYAESISQKESYWAAHDPASREQPIDPLTKDVAEIPWAVQTKPMIVRDVQMAKLHSAVLTTDPESNLYMCGHGQGCRLGTGDERTRFAFVCIEGGALAGKKITSVALGLNHTVALSDQGEIYSWGSNGYGQLGFALPKTPSSDEEPVCPSPRQIFGPLKREMIHGIAASRIHSVAHTSSSLYTFGKNEGQLGMVDSDARSLEMQTTPRKVAASLFGSPIATVTAIDKATVCLLESREVWVFANYGRTKVQFPLEGFSNYFLRKSFLVTSYDNAPNQITKITGSGDSICALSSRGEVFTMPINQNYENQASASTTNPRKIKNAITTPQRIWDLKKNNMAARDVGVDADGSIILTTEEGSVWKRSRRAKIKDASASGTGEYKAKDYKFSRISGLTRVLAVRASGYGAYAAVRRDCDVTKTQIVVDPLSLWKDLFPLLSLTHLRNGSYAEADEMRPRFWQNHRKVDEIKELKKVLMQAKDIEAELSELADSCFSDSTQRYDAVLATTTSDIVIPVHRFVLTGRSRVLRRGFRDLCELTTFTISDLCVTEFDSNGRTVIKFQGLDILTIVDLALYLYTDEMIEYWHLTRNASSMAFRYRQIRTELMKVAAKLELTKLESAVRQMVPATPCLGMDFELAVADPAYFYDGDVIVQLEDEEVRLHSALACARCPFFESLFVGRAGGRWLADRQNEKAVHVDLTETTAKTFQLVLRYLYCDSGAEIFDDIVSTDLDEFLDNVMDVLAAANELMLDRLSQICQSVIGRYVDVRNVCSLLNAVSPSAVHEFKDACLEYLCLSLESLLQGHHLNELEEDLLHELDEVVRENQLACMPFAKSGRADRLLHERYPDLAAVIERNRQTKIDAVTLRSRHQDVDNFAPGSLGDETAMSPALQKARRRPSANTPRSDGKPNLKSKASSKDMMFSMDEEYDSGVYGIMSSPSIRPAQSPKIGGPSLSSTPQEEWYDSRGRPLASPKLGPQQSLTPGVGTPKTSKSPQIDERTPDSSGRPWGIKPLPGAKTDLKEMLSQAAKPKTSSLSQGLASSQASSTKPSDSFGLPAPKLSQKERKKMMQTQQASSSSLQTPSPSSELLRPNSGKAPSPWQTVSATKVPALKDALEDETAKPPPNTRTTSTPHLTMRQTIANHKAPPKQQQQPIISPSGQKPMPQRTTSGSKSTQNPSPPSQRSTSLPQAQSSNSKPIPQSIRHTLQAEPNLQLSMQDILAMQQMEKDVIKEAVAPRDLQDIQAEQEFQEWWDKEAARMQEAENSRSGNAPKGPKKRGRGGGKGARGGKKVEAGGREKGEGEGTRRV